MHCSDGYFGLSLTYLASQSRTLYTYNLLYKCVQSLVDHCPITLISSQYYSWAVDQVKITYIIALPTQ